MVEAPTMSDMERYLFDLNGFIVVRGVGRKSGFRPDTSPCV